MRPPASPPAPSATTALLADLKAALARRDRAATNRAVAGLLDARAPLGPQWQKLSQLMQVSGELTLAHRAMDAFVAASGGNPQAVCAKVVLLESTGQRREADALMKTLPADVPDRGGHALLLGNTAMVQGQVDAARDYFTTALDFRPGWGAAWLSLGTSIKLAGDPLGERLVAEGAAAAVLPPADHARYLYALGKYRADRGEADAAFAAFAKGAALLRREAPYAAAGDEANARDAASGFSAGAIERWNGQVGIDTSRPIFVTGLPRSGTTLVEHILASHSAVADGGELNIVQHLAVAAGGVSGDAIERYLAGGGTMDTLAELYLHLLNERMGTTGRIVDKTIDVSRCLGLIASALPDAPLIWMRRDPLDCAWSCFRTFFIHGVGWSYDLADIARHFMLEDGLLAFWKERLGDRLLVVPYADLVEAPEVWTRRLLDHCGLAEESGAFEPHRTDRVVATASALQVRRPINRDGLNVAAPYRAHLQPFIDLYRPAA
jgi:tetratricopeptide (TPR) repeat protein